MNAPVQRNALRMSVQTDRVADPIDAFMPWVGDEERALRQRLHRAWTIGAAKAAVAVSDNARILYWQASQIASDWTFKRAPAADLKDIADSLVRMFMAAATIERIEVPTTLTRLALCAGAIERWEASDGD